MNRKGFLFVLMLLYFSFTHSFAQLKRYSPFNYTSQKNVTCKNAAVVCAHPLAGKVGISILKSGGNAFDAAIAMQLALAVVYPGAGNLGGGGFMIAHLVDGRNIALDYREKAPGTATRDMYLDSAGNALMHLSQDGQLSAGVPGTIAGIFAEMKYAKLPVKKLIQPAIDLAENGFAITASQASGLNLLRDDFLNRNAALTAFTKEGDWKAGDILVQKDLSATLKRIRDKGLLGFYGGETARLILVEMQRGKGIITSHDLKNYAVVEREPLEFDYKKYHVITMPLPSSGGILLEQMMKMANLYGISRMRFQSLASVQLMTEVERRAFADRGEFLGDPDFVRVPVKTLVSDDYLKDRMKDYKPGIAGMSATTKPGNIPESEETTHLNVLDKFGNAVAITTTLNDSYGSKIVVSGAGFILNNEMDDFSVKPGLPNMYGAIGNDKNAIAPGKRMLSSMTPTIVLCKGKPYIITGTPGATTIPTSIFQTLTNLMVFGLNAEDAVNKPKFHHQWLPDSLFIEKEFPAGVTKKLEKMGYNVKKRPPIGRTELILIKRRSINVVGDRRGDDDAEGY